MNFYPVPKVCKGRGQPQNLNLKLTLTIFFENICEFHKIIDINWCYSDKSSLTFIDAWLITGGTNVGVVKEVGEALNNYRYKHRTHGLVVPCIGICTWEYIAGSDQLANPAIESQLVRLNLD
jgi:hypothetical protein